MADKPKKRLNIALERNEYQQLCEVGRLRRLQPGTLARLWFVERLESEVSKLNKSGELVDGAVQQNLLRKR